MCINARADKRRVGQGDRMGDSKATESNREGNLPASFGIQERAMKDTWNPSMKLIIESTKRLKNVKGEPSVDEVKDFAKP